MKKFAIDLSSDTKTLPTIRMRSFMMEAEVGDEQIGEDPTVNLLLKKVCKILGKENALYLPTGTMCNQIAIRTHCMAGDEIIADKTSHIRNFEVGGSAALSGTLISPLQGTNGIFTPDQFRKAIRPYSNYSPRSSLTVVEQTSNRGGGTVWPFEYIQEISEIALAHGLKRHMDGARLFNAVIKTGISADKYSKYFDSVWIDFSKGLGAPMGAVLAGSASFISKARRYKHQFGGALRQAGIMAAGGIYALENNIERIYEDHNNLIELAEGLKNIEGIEIKPYQTNILFFDIKETGLNAKDFNDRLAAHSLRFTVSDEYLLRAVTHLNIDKEDIKKAIKIVKTVISN